MGAAAAHAGPGALEREIARIGASTGGNVGVSVRHLPSGEERAYNADQSFPMASTYKTVIGGCVLQRVDRDEFALETLVPILPRQRSTSSVLSSQFPHPGLSVSVHNLLELMLTSSDNTATDVLLELVGGPAEVQRCVEGSGVTDLRVDRSTAQILRDYGGVPYPADPSVSFFEQFVPLYAKTGAPVYFEDGSGAQYVAFERDPRDHATPRAMTDLMARIWKDEWPSKEGATVLRGILSRSAEPVRLARGLPAGTPLAHKTGTLSGTVNDSGVFDLPDGQGQVVITVYVKGARGPHEGTEIAIGDIARLVYDEFVLDPPGPLH